MTTITHYSIWLMPSGKINEELKKTISKLSHEFAGPVFLPHVTLLGNLDSDKQELLSHTQQLAAHIRPFQVTLTTVDFFDEYFWCLFLRTQETAPLLEAEREARMIFHREQDPNFMPHLSLLYGNFELLTKKQIIEAIGHEFNISFSVRHINLFSTTGKPMDWYRVQKFVLQGRQESSHD
jgi:2'-5' RNA ligase